MTRPTSSSVPESLDREDATALGLRLGEAAAEAREKLGDDAPKALARIVDHILVRALEEAGLTDYLDRYRTAIGLAPFADDARLSTLDTATVPAPEAFAIAASVLTPEDARKSSGVVFTPRDVARFMAAVGFASLAPEADGLGNRTASWLAGKPDEPPAKPPRILDPAAGTGVFLLTAARLLEPALDGSSFEKRRALLESSLFGLEQSPDRALLARLGLILYLLEDTSPGDDAASEPPALTGTVLVGDPLVDRFQGESDGTLFGTDSNELPIPAGFDLVLANPPYVRQERIPHDRKIAIQRRFSSGSARGFSRRSDLYVYFFALLPRLLSERGVAVMITSNSWLNAGYGQELRRFLLDAVRLRLVLEPRDERWFSSSSVNAGITVLEAAESTTDRVSFVTTTAPLARMLGDSRWVAELVEGPAGSHAGYRRVDLAHDALEEGSRDDDDASTARTPWGVYLSAPTAHLELRETAHERLVPLKSLADVRFGLKTGANRFFYVTDCTDTTEASDLVDYDESDRERFAGGELRAVATQLLTTDDGQPRPTLIEPRFLAPAFVSPRDARGLAVKESELRWRAVTLPADERELEGTHAAKYVKRGEELGLHRRPSCAGRSAWWSLPIQEPPPLAHALIVHQRPALFRVPENALVDANLVWIVPESADAELAVIAGMLSSFGLLSREFYLMTNLGEGALKANPIYLGEIPVPRTIPRGLKKPLREVLREIEGRAHLTIDEEVRREDRRTLDELVLQALGVESERERWRLREEIAKGLVEATSSRIRRSSNPRAEMD